MTEKKPESLLTEEQARRYLADDHGRCPFCQSLDTYGSAPYRPKGRLVEALCECNACLAAWVDVFKPYRIETWTPQGDLRQAFEHTPSVLVEIASGHADVTSTGDVTEVTIDWDTIDTGGVSLERIEGMIAGLKSIPADLDPGGESLARLEEIRDSWGQDVPDDDRDEH